MGVARTVLGIAVALAGGCQNILGLDTPGRQADAGDEIVVDGPPGIDAPVGGPMIDGFDLLPYQPSAAPLVFATDTSIVTTTGSVVGCIKIDQTMAGTNPACLIYASDVTIESGVTVTATGGNPLIIAATGTVAIRGVLVVEAGRDISCQAPAGAGANASYGSGGGAGGSFGSEGADGGSGDQFNNAGGGAAAQIPAPSLMRGGCRGGSGGNATGTGTGLEGFGGSSGGGVWILGRGSVVVSGRVIASGLPGTGGGVSAGAGGGGSGGYVRIAAHSTVAIGGSLFANGGGGGEGGSSSGPPGATGQPGQPSLFGAPGGMMTGGADGGIGAALGPAQNGYPGSFGGGGGGGGGAGHIVLRGMVAIGGSTISPAPAIN